MQKKFNILILSLFTLLVIVFVYWWQRGDALLVQPLSDSVKQNSNNTIKVENVTNEVIDESLSDDFIFTGTQEMHICNSRAICHRGNVVFEFGDVLTISDDNGNNLGVSDSSCNDKSCYVEDEFGKEWDLVFIKK